MVAYYFRQLRRYGVRGALDFLGACVPVWRRIAFFYVNLITHPFVRPQKGVTLIGNFTGAASDSKTMRDMAFALKEAGIPYQTLNIDTSNVASNVCTLGLLTPKSEFCLRKFSNVIELHKSHVPNVRGVRRGRIFFWEYESGLLKSNPYLDSKWEVIALSDYNYRYYSEALPEGVPVRKVLYPFQPLKCSGVSCLDLKRKYGYRETDFVVFFNFGLGSDRKNPFGCLQAFARAFKDDCHARLLLKVAYEQQFPQCLAKLRVAIRELKIEDQVRVVTGYVSDAQIRDMTELCDVYLSLHRGEGFGLGMAEAMSTGKAVVATAYSANLEFCKDYNSMLVPYRIVSLSERDEFERMSGVETWADPDVDFAAGALRRLREDSVLRVKIGTAAKHYIETYFSTCNFKQSICTYLDEC